MSRGNRKNKRRMRPIERKYTRPRKRVKVSIKPFNKSDKTIPFDPKLPVNDQVRKYVLYHNNCHWTDVRDWMVQTSVDGKLPIKSTTLKEYIREVQGPMKNKEIKFKQTQKINRKHRTPKIASVKDAFHKQNAKTVISILNGATKNTQIDGLEFPIGDALACGAAVRSYFQEIKSYKSDNAMKQKNLLLAASFPTRYNDNLGFDITRNAFVNFFDIGNNNSATVAYETRKQFDIVNGNIITQFEHSC